MTYIISDIHGCYAEYIALLEKIKLSDEDEVYILGDAMDRGPEPIKVIRDIMNRPNAFYVLGNHDLMLLNVMGKLAVDITEANLEALSEDFFSHYYNWMRNGGGITATQFLEISKEERADILDFVRNSPTCETVEYEEKLYLLVHAGIANFAPEKELTDYEPIDFLWERADYSRQYFPGDRIFLVTGHTPTMLVREDRQPLVFKENCHIAVDCGCVYGGRLAAYCIETGEATYVDGLDRKN